MFQEISIKHLLQCYLIYHKINSQKYAWPGSHNILKLYNPKSHTNDNVHVSRIEMGLHTGTHIDFPYHILMGKKPRLSHRLL